MYSKIIDAYISSHESTYQAKYCYHSCDRIDEKTFKFHYYVRDVQLLQMNIFLEIYLGEEIQVKVMEDIHEQEEYALACDALNRIRGYTNRKTTIAPQAMAGFVEKPDIKESLTPQDMINVLNYIEYHHGKNPDSIYLFYTIFIPYLEKRFSKKKYKEAMQACNLLLDEILYEVFWYGINIKYLDQEHLMHQAYIRSIINLIGKNFEEITVEASDLLLEMLTQTFQYWRFAFSIYSSLENMVENYPEAMTELLEKMNIECLKNKTSGAYLVFATLLAVLRNDGIGYRQSVKEVLKLLMGDIISLANPEEQEQTGIVFLKIVGFDILLEIFDETHDSYVYNCFAISDIPEDLHPYIQKQLEDALKYYASLMDDDKHRMIALSQITNISTLLMENFKVL